MRRLHAGADHSLLVTPPDGRLSLVSLHPSVGGARLPPIYLSISNSELLVFCLLLPALLPVPFLHLLLYSLLPTLQVSYNSALRTARSYLVHPVLAQGTPAGLRPYSSHLYCLGSEAPYGPADVLSAYGACAASVRRLVVYVLRRCPRA